MKTDDGLNQNQSFGDKLRLYRESINQLVSELDARIIDVDKGLGDLHSDMIKKGELDPEESLFLREKYHLPTVD